MLAALRLDAVWRTLRDLAVRPFTVIDRVARGTGGNYVGPVRMVLGLVTVYIVVSGVLFPSPGILDQLRDHDGDFTLALVGALEQHGVDLAHFEERFALRLQSTISALTLVESGCIALLLSLFRRDRFAVHLAYVFYLYAAYLIMALVAVVGLSVGVSEVTGWPGWLVGTVLFFGLPTMIVAGLPRFYPTRWRRQVARATFLFVASTVVGFVFAPLSQGLALAWTLISFGV